MRRMLNIAVGVVLLSACAAGSAGPIFDFRPTAGPLNYAIAFEQSLLIEVPGQAQTADQELEAGVQLEIGDARSVTASFEALTVRNHGSAGESNLEGGALVGQPFRGSISESGVITVSDGPEVEGALTDAMDPTSVFANILTPLPPDPNATSWPVNTSISASALVSTITNFAGEARFAELAG